MEHLQPLQQNTSKLARQSINHEDPGSLQCNYQGTSSIVAPPIQPITPQDQQDSGRLSNGGGPTSNNMGANIGLTREYIDPEKKILRVLCQRYELKEEVGKGAHGQIFSGKDKISRQPIAIKIMEKISKNKSKFVREISLMKDMNKFCQLGFPRLYYHSSDKNYYYIVMEQLQSSLKDLRDLQQDKKFSIKTVTMIALQMLQRLESIHKYGYVHRDLKPANIMVGKNFKTQELTVVYLIDFGLTKKQNQVSNLPNQDLGNKVVGTAVYAGINAHLPSANYFKKDDVESLMYVLCYLGTGTLPWKSYKSTDIGLEKMMKYKIKISPFDLFQGMPTEYGQILDYIKNLTSDTAIDYQYIESLLRQVAQNCKFKLDNRFDWILSQQTPSMPLTPVTPSRLLQQNATGGFNNTLNEQTSKQLIGHPSDILKSGNTQNIRNSTIRKPLSIASPNNEDSQTPNNNRPGIINGQVVSLGQSNAMLNSNPDIYSGYMAGSAGMGLGKPQHNMMDSHMDNSNLNFQSQMANTQNNEPASPSRTLHLDFKSKQEFADVGTNQNKFQDLKNFSNKFTLRPETTLPGGPQQQSVNFIDNDTNMVQSKGLLVRCEASELTNNEGGIFAQSQRKPNQEKSSMIQSNLLPPQKQSQTNLPLTSAIQENLLQVPGEVAGIQQNQIEKHTKYNKKGGIKKSKSPQNGSRNGQANEGEEKPSTKKKFGPKTKKKTQIGDPKNKSQNALLNFPNEQVNNNNTSQTQVITIMKERGPSQLQKDSQINLTDNNDITLQKKEVSVGKLTIVPEEGGTQMKSSGGSSKVNKKLGGLAPAASGASNLPNDQQVSFAINKQQQIEVQQVVLINMSNQSNNANNQVLSNVDSSGRVPNFAAASMNNGGEVSEAQNKKYQSKRGGAAADIDVEKIAENMHIMISEVQQSRQEMSKQVIESLTFEEFEQGILSERMYMIQSKPDISLHQFSNNNKSNQEQKIVNTQIGVLSPREFYTHSNLEKMRNQTSKSLILTSQQNNYN